jgi:hypothetical protein
MTTILRREEIPMAKHRLVTGPYTKGSKVILYRNPANGTFRAEPDAAHNAVFDLPVQLDESGPYVEPPVTDEQLTALTSICSD